MECADGDAAVVACELVSTALGVGRARNTTVWVALMFDREFSSKDLRSVGNYTLGRLIGKGSFGKVYLASHKLTNGSKVRRPRLRGCAWRC